MLMASALRWLLASVSSAIALVKTDNNTIEKKARARLLETGRLTVTKQLPENKGNQMKRNFIPNEIN